MELAAAAFVILLVVLLVRGSQKSSERTTMLAALAAGLGGTSTSNSASGRHRDVATTLSFTSSGTSSNTSYWTKVECALPPGYPFALHLERHGFWDRGKIARGDMVDVVVGDAPFDETFRVEGAPADVVRRVLGADVRGYLLARERPSITTEGATLTLTLSGWQDQLPDARAAIECAAAIAGAVRGASLELDAAVPMAQDGPAYRAIASDAPLQEARAAREAEVAKVESTRTSRRASENVLTWVLLVGGLVAAYAVLSSR